MGDGTRIRRACLLDTETGGLDAEKHPCIEIAVMLYDVERAAPIASFASLLRAESNEAESINGIPVEMVKEARSPDEVWRAVKWLIGPADVVIAHRAEFDRKFVPDLGKPWICTKTDIKWPNRMRGDHLVQLALGLGLGVASAHRAMADVDTLSRILTRTAEIIRVTGLHSLEGMLLHALRPKLKFIAEVSYDDRQKAKDHGFLWDDKAREWYRFMPPEDVNELPFKVHT